MAVLQTLNQEGPMDARTVRDQTEASRSTVKRTLDALSEREWVTQIDGEYQITPTGSVVLDGYLEFETTIQTATRVAPVFRWLPDFEPSFDLRELADATVVEPVEGEPYAPSVRQTELMQSVEFFHGLFPSIGVEGTRFVHERIISGELTAEIVVSTGVAATIRKEPYASLFDEQMATGRLTLFVAERVPYYLGIPANGSVHLGVEDDDGLPRALLETEATAVRQWAIEQYDAYRERASALPRDAFG